MRSRADTGGKRECKGEHLYRETPHCTHKTEQNVTQKTQDVAYKIHHINYMK